MTDETINDKATKIARECHGKARELEDNFVRSGVQELLRDCDSVIADLLAEKDAAVEAEREAIAYEICELEEHDAEQHDWLDGAWLAKRIASAVRDCASTDALEAVRQEARDEALRKAAEAWRQLRYVAVQNTNDPEEWAALIARMDAALFPAGQEGDE